MPRRFEVVAPPVEQRVQAGLQDQALTAIKAAKGVFGAIEHRRIGAMNTTRTLLNDDAFVASVAGNAAALAMPSALPGFLLVVALALKVVHWAALRLAASRAVAKHNLLVTETSRKSE